MLYQAETVEQVLPEMSSLNELHYDEIATHKDLKVLKPDYDKYLEMERLGMLRVFTVRNQVEERGITTMAEGRYRGDLIGYFVTFISPHMHYSDCIYALNDILYIHPDYRGGTVGYRLFKEAMQDLRDNTEATILCIHMKVEYPFRQLLGKLGFSLTEEN